jgi:hypothetical protein
MIENMLNIAAPAEKVFDFVVDVRNEPHWNPQMVHAEMLSPEPVGVGGSASGSVAEWGWADQ